MSDVTQILSQIESGDPSAADKLLPLVYEELRKLAAAKLAHEKPGQTLQATALVHEAYLRLVGGTQEQYWHNRGHFFAAAAEAMRRILVDAARRKGSVKRGGQRAREELLEVAAPDDGPVADLLAVHEALTVLESQDPLAAKLVKLRHFVGLTMDEAAEALSISPRTAYYTWAYARSWLHKAIAGETDASPDSPPS